MCKEHLHLTRLGSNSRIHRRGKAHHQRGGIAVADLRGKMHGHTADVKATGILMESDWPSQYMGEQSAQRSQRHQAASIGKHKVCREIYIAVLYTHARSVCGELAFNIV